VLLQECDGRLSQELPVIDDGEEVRMIDPSGHGEEIVPEVGDPSPIEI
jgi:hypothetical protein